MQSAIEQAIEAHLACERARRLAPGTLVAHRYDLARFSFFCRRRKLTAPTAVTGAHIEDFAVWLARVYRTGRHPPGRRLRPATVVRTLRSVRSFFARLVREDHILIDPCGTLEIRSGGRSILDRSIDARAFAQLVASLPLTTARDVRNRMLLELLFGCGLRRSELTGLDSDDADTTRGLLRVRRGKGGKGRIVPLVGEARHWVVRYLAMARPELVTAASGRALVLATGGQRMSGATLAWIVREAVRKAGLVQRVTPHGLRHSCATGLIRGGADVRAVQLLLGHARIDTTEHYTHLNVDDLKRVHRRTHPRERRR